MKSNRLFCLVLVISIIVTSAKSYERKFLHDMPKMLTQNINITTYAGETVKLPCELSSLGNYHVNWLKIHNHLPMALTVGYQQFSRNMRYRVARVVNEDKNTESWNFEIRRVQHSDSGLYECYVKVGQRHKIKAKIFLDVRRRQEITKKPHSERLSSNKVERMNIEPNSWIKLRCNASNSLLHPVSSDEYPIASNELQWFKDGVVIEQDSRRLKKWVASYDNSNYMELDLFAVDLEDSGNYQCKRDKTILKNVILQVNSGNFLNFNRSLSLLLYSILFLVLNY